MLGSKPERDEASIASYNVACCYSKLNQVPRLFMKLFSLSKNLFKKLARIKKFFGFLLLQVQAGLSALEDAMQAGYDDFKVNKCSFLCSDMISSVY